MVLAIGHRSEHAFDENERDMGMKQIAHRVDKNHPWRFPRAWQIDDIVVQSDPIAVCVSTIAHFLQPERKPFGITVLAAGAHLRATRYRIPCRFRPLDMRVSCHEKLPCPETYQKCVLRFYLRSYLVKQSISNKQSRHGCFAWEGVEART